MFSAPKNKADPTSLRKELMVVWGMGSNPPSDGEWGIRHLGSRGKRWRDTRLHPDTRHASPPLPLTLPSASSFPSPVYSIFLLPSIPLTTSPDKRDDSFYQFFPLYFFLFLPLYFSFSFILPLTSIAAAAAAQQSSQPRENPFSLWSPASLKAPAGSRSVTEWSLWEHPQNIYNLRFDCVPS